MQLVIKALTNNAPDVKQALPVTFTLMSAFKAQLNQSLLDITLWSCMTTLFFGCLRAGELVPSLEQISSGMPVPKVSDLHFIHTPAPAVIITIARTKTKPKGINVILGCSGHSVCPLCALLVLLKCRGIGSTLNVNLCLYELPDGQPMHKKYFMDRLHGLLRNLGIDPRGFTPHSMRAGGATQLALNGASEQLIQKIGHWSSLCYRRYIRESVHSIAAYSKLFIPSYQS